MHVDRSRHLEEVRRLRFENIGPATAGASLLDSCGATTASFGSTNDGATVLDKSSFCCGATMASLGSTNAGINCLGQTQLLLRRSHGSSGRGQATLRDSSRAVAAAVRITPLQLSYRRDIQTCVCAARSPVLHGSCGDACNHGRPQRCMFHASMRAC